VALEASGGVVNLTPNPCVSLYPHLPYSVPKPVADGERLKNLRFKGRMP